VFLLAIPASLDLTGSTIMTFALTQMAGSIYQMFRGSLILFTTLLAIIFLKKKLYLHHYLAGSCVIIGLALVGVAALVMAKADPNEPHTTVVGVLLVIVAQVFASIQFIVEEKLVKSYYCHPLKLVGWEGIWGGLIYIILMVILAQINCDSLSPADLQSAMCTFVPDDGHWWVEAPIFALKQIFTGGTILPLYVFIYIFSIAVFNFSGITVTKHLSSPARAVLDSVRTVTVWLFFLVLPESVLLSLKESFLWLQLVGFVILLFGTVVFNEILVLPFLGLNLNTEEAIKERERIAKCGLLPDSLGAPGIQYEKKNIA